MNLVSFHFVWWNTESPTCNQRNSLSTEFLLRSVVLQYKLTVYLLIYFIQRFPYSSAIIVKCKVLVMVPGELASRPRKLCPCEKNTGSGTRQHICAAVTRMGIRELLKKKESEQTHTMRLYMLQVILFLRLINCNQTRSFCFNLGHFILN